MAMRAMSEAPAAASVDEELPNVLYSPSGSATTGLSGGSSLGLQYKGSWCTPPRVFVDYRVLLSCIFFIKFGAFYFDFNDPSEHHGISFAADSCPCRASDA